MVGSCRHRASAASSFFPSPHVPSPPFNSESYFNSTYFPFSASPLFLLLCRLSPDFPSLHFGHLGWMHFSCSSCASLPDFAAVLFSGLCAKIVYSDSVISQAQDSKVSFLGCSKILKVISPCDIFLLHMYGHFF